MNKQLSFDLNVSSKPSVQTQKTYGKPRLKSPSRYQIAFRTEAIDDIIPQNHRVRLVWDFVNSLDLSNIANKSKSVEGGVGRSATDPKLLFGLWLYGITEGIGSARTLNKYCKEHKAFIWMCGGVEVNYHTLSDFRANNTDELDDLFTQTIATLMNHEIVSLKRTSQDGMRVRASAGRSSFRKKPKLKELLKEAKEHIKTLKKQSENDPSFSRKEKAAKERAARERVEKLNQALKTMSEINKQIDKNEARRSKTEIVDAKKKAKASTTDPNARIMKMPNSGFNPAYNFQFATDTKSRVIIGVDVTTNGTDTGEMVGMLNQIKSRMKISPTEHLLDPGYIKYEDIEKAETLHKCKIIMPPKKTKKLVDPYVPLPGDSPIIAAWRKRMGTEGVKEMYKLRASTAEYVNARARNCGLYQILVRGLEKVKSMALLYAITHNMMRKWALT